jgi:putative MFS transporter
VIFSSFIIAYLLRVFGVGGVFLFIAAAMAVVMATIAVFGPRVSGKALERISN